MSEPLLEQASLLLGEEGPVTLAKAKAFDALCEQASGEEAQMLGDLWETFLMKADADAYAYMTRIEEDA